MVFILECRECGVEVELNRPVGRCPECLKGKLSLVARKSVKEPEEEEVVDVLP